MAHERSDISPLPPFQEVLGYLNFSSGAADPQFLRCLNEIFASIERTGEPVEPGAWAEVGRKLRSELEQLAPRERAFQDAEQAREVLRLACDVFPARYREFHCDLLQHQPDAELLRPFFLGRVCEAVLAQGGPWQEDQRIITGAIRQLNDYIGYRPVAVLRTAQRIEPYPHEWVRPVPLYVRGAGVAAGRYHALLSLALEMLRKTEPAILADAYFDPEKLDELALDPRAYDFDHPVNKRPNYHFGQWDPHQIDRHGHYRRFVVQQVTLDVLLERVEEQGDLPREELLVEAAAVLAGTILMASATSGDGPDAHDSSTTLSNLLPRIAAYRDSYYERVIARLTGPHGERLREEAVAGKQPLAGARQHLNQQLARRRAAQLERVHLARLFARLGYAEAALRQAQVVSVAAARMAGEIQCRLTTGHLALDRGELAQVWTMVVEAEDFLHRAIECGSLADPWNILGFQGQFSLFPSPENSVPDHRLDQLIELVEQIVDLYARLWSEAAIGSDEQLPATISDRLSALARWWDQFASTTVEGIESFSGAEAFDSAREVADTLKAFHQAGAAAGDIAFWRKRVAHFASPKAYALVTAALLRKPDLVAARALLMQWLSQAGLMPLKQGEYSFHELVERWLADASDGSGTQALSPEERRTLVQKFFDLLEANAEDAWQVPELELPGLETGRGPARKSGPQADDRDDDSEDDSDDDSDDDEDSGDEEDDEDRDEDLYGAAYDEMVYIDSTGDGIDADMLESGPGPVTDYELEQEARRTGERLALLRTVALLWQRAVLAGQADDWPTEMLARWHEQAVRNERKLLELLQSVSDRRVPEPTASRDSLLEFDRRRAVKESLLERIVSAVVETDEAARAISAHLPLRQAGTGEAALWESAVPASGQIQEMLRAVVRQDRAAVERLWPDFLAALSTQTLLYVPLSRQGDPARLVETRVLQQVLRDLLAWLPKLGLLRETCQLLEAARLMESANPVGAGAISEYDRLFAAGYESLVEALVVMSDGWPSAGEGEKADNELVECLEPLTETLLKQWLAHSRTLRLSVLERIGDEKSWQALRQFIEHYGHDLFTQRFLNLGNLRAILHQGVDTWLDKLIEQPATDQEEFKLLSDLGEQLSRSDAIKHLSLVIEAIVENYAEYRDYNSTTTQSDRGEMLYTLLDFLRLRVHYDRVAWHLKPVIVAHAVLVRRGRSGAAEMWRRALAERTGELADNLQQKGNDLRKKYAMRLPTVTDRLAERFIRPLVIDRVRALVKPALEDARRGQTDWPDGAFVVLEQETEELTHEPTGVGLEVPAWLAALEQEADDQLRSRGYLAGPEPCSLSLVQVTLEIDEAQRQLTDWERHPH